LSEWRTDAALPPRFQEQVWERIASAEAAHQPSLFATVRWLAALLMRPSVATAYAMILLLIGITAGCQQGQTKSESIKSQLQTRYVQMVDPYQTPRR